MIFRPTSFLASILLASALSACSVHRNSGRNNFENQIGDRPHKTEVGSASFPEEDSSSECWTQPVNEPLWFIEQNKRFDISVQDQLMEVCLVEDAQQSSARGTADHNDQLGQLGTTNYNHQR